MLQTIKVLHPGDKTVALLLGKQTAPEHPAELLRPSRFVFYVFAGDGYALFHTLTKKTVLVAPALIRFFLGGGYTLEELRAQGAEELFEDCFIVRDGADEYRDYREVRNIYLKKLLNKGQIERYVILPLTACNARCVYCYEETLTDEALVMTDEIQGRLISFIRAHAPKSKPVLIQWFGGEPLCGSQRIDKICQALTGAGIPFLSTMVTNGSLFSAALSEKAARDWKLEEAQITLDGTKAEYEKRKRYLPGLSSPFETVIQNIHHLLSAGIRVTIRLNADMENLGDLFACADFLAEEFSEQEKQGIRVYAHELFSCDSDTEMLDALLERLEELNLYIARCFPSGRKAGEEKKIHRFDPMICMANPAGNTVVVAPDGRLFACEHMPEELSLGSLEDGIDLGRLEAIREERIGESHCKSCAFLPICSDFERCPSRILWPHCQRKKEREMKYRMGAYLQGGRSHVSDPGC